MTVYLVDLESIPTRYTCQWKSYLPSILSNAGYNVEIISGPDDLPDNTTPGMFLNFSATNIYKAEQVRKIAMLFSDGVVSDNDYFLFADAWHPGVINLKYMADLFNIRIQIGGLWHAGSYDPADGLGMRIGNKPWVRNAEASMFYCYDDNFFASRFHINLFKKSFEVHADAHEKSIKRVGWPMEYLEKVIYTGEKENLIVFPHRLSEEKNVDIFRDLSTHPSLSSYEFVVCQDKKLTKKEYHSILARAKIVFSANLQETLGIGVYEGVLAGAIPIVPDRLSYTEMYFPAFRYPSDWTISYHHYEKNKKKLVNFIKEKLENYDSIERAIYDQKQYLTRNYFSSSGIIRTLR